MERELGTWIWEDVWTKNQALQALNRYQGAATQLITVAQGKVESKPTERKLTVATEQGERDAK